MNEFTAKKLGEVLAFAVVGLDTINKGKGAITETFGPEKTTELIKSNENQIQKITQIAEESGVLETVKIKAEATGEKLKKMRDLYIGEEWDNPTELLEWSGFFEGAAIVHWSLVTGAGEGIKNDELLDLATEAQSFHHELFVEAEQKLYEFGKKRSSQ